MWPVARRLRLQETGETDQASSCAESVGRAIIGMDL